MPPPPVGFRSSAHGRGANPTVGDYFFEEVLSTTFVYSVYSSVWTVLDFLLCQSGALNDLSAISCSSGNRRGGGRREERREEYAEGAEGGVEGGR